MKRSNEKTYSAFTDANPEPSAVVQPLASAKGKQFVPISSNLAPATPF